MAKVTVKTDNPAEAATLAEILSRHGSGVVDAMVTGWIREHAESFDRDRARAIVEASRIDPAFASKAVQTATEATTIIETDTAAKKEAERVAAAAAEEAAKKATEGATK